MNMSRNFQKVGNACARKAIMCAMHRMRLDACAIAALEGR